MTALAPDPFLPALQIPREWSAGFVAPVLVEYLLRIHLGCCVVQTADGPWCLLSPNAPEPARLHFETAYGHGGARERYTAESITRALAEQRAFVGNHRGYDDFFVPIVQKGRSTGCIVAGPFIRSPLTAADVTAQWTSLSGRSADPSDPELLAYAHGALRTLLLEEPLFGACFELLRTLGEVMGAEHLAVRAVQRFASQHTRAFDGSRFTMLELARGLVERPVTRNWQHENMGPRYRALGVTRMFTHVLAVALDPRDEPREDPVTRLVRAFDLQRRCCALAVEMGQTIAGPIGDGGAFFLTSIDGAAGPSALDRKVDAIRALLREQLGTNTSIGVSDATADGDDLPRAYDEAILSLEWALHEAEAVVFHRRRARHKSASVRSPYRLRVLELRRAVSAGSRRASELAAVGVSREVVRRAGGAPETARAHFENVVFELLDVVEERGLDARSVRSLETAALARLNEARTVYALGTTFQAIAAELGASVRRPSPASRAARLAAARRYIDKNLHHPLTLNDAAREAGFSPRYFSTLFKQRNGRGFERYLTARRLERARDLLRTTELPVARVSRDAGFRSEIHFYGAFKRAYGITPKTCREQAAQRR